MGVAGHNKGSIVKDVAKKKRLNGGIWGGWHNWSGMLEETNKIYIGYSILKW